MMRVLVFLPLFLNSIISKGQYIKGTHIIVAPCKGGILIASDSRTAFFATQPEENDIPQAYFDGVQKIFPIKDFVFVNSNLGSVGDSTIHYYFNKFSKQCKDSSNLLDRWNEWWGFVSRNKEAKTFQLVQIIAAKYDKGKPHILLYSGGYNLQEIYTYLETDTSSGFKNDYSIKLSWRKLVTPIEMAIQKISNKKKYPVGGKVAILLIKPNNKMIWIKNKPKHKQYDALADVWDAYKHGDLKVNFTNNIIKQQMDSLLKTIK
jgi:hypothetical protein